MPNLSPRTARLAALDRQYVWHPFTPMKAWVEKDDPVIIERGEGVYLIDSEGRAYIDGVSSLWCNLHGHHVPELDAAVRSQLECIAHSTLLGLANIPAAELAARLVEIAPAGLTKVFYSDNGSTAVEVACKMAYQYHVHAGQPQRSRFIAFTHSYHGDTLGAVSVGGIPAFHGAFRPLCFPADFVDPPVDPFAGDLAAHACFAGSTPPVDAAAPFARRIMDLLKAQPDRYAGIVIEPLVQGAGGMVMHPPGTLRTLRAIADQYGVLLIFDEVMTGFGRTGKMFACQHEGVSPDLLCLSKGLTGGYMPLGATLASQRVFDAFYADPAAGKTFLHGHTFTGHPLACAVAIASLQLLQDRRMVEAVEEQALALAETLQPLRDHPHVAQVRQRGLVAAVELVRSRRPLQQFPPAWRVGGALCTAMRSRGVMLRPLADVLVIMPPLATDIATVRRLGSTVADSLAELPAIITRKQQEHPDG